MYRNRVAGLATLAMLVLATACSSAAPDAAGGAAAEPVASPDDSLPGGVKKPARRPGSGKAGRPSGERNPGSGGHVGATSPRDRGPDRSEPGTRPAAGVASASAAFPDPSGDGDREGDPPAYADIRRAALKGTGRTLRLILRVDGTIPEALPDGSDVTVNFRIERKGAGDHQIYAIGGSSGWSAYLDDSGSFPGRFEIVDDRFVFELAWSELGGPARLRWEAESAWTDSPSGPLDQTEFSFDRVPEYRTAFYPG